jgi:ElaB/YqjD/DUF883 family membrane-anchored ribosome-binding protein
MSATPETTGKIQREPEDVQREADAIREDLDRTLTALDNKLSPDQLLDRSLDFMRENGGELLQKIGATVNRNPLPLLVTSAGLIWLLASSRSSATQRLSSGPSTAPRTGDFDRSAQSFGSSVEGKARGLKQRALDATRSRASRTWNTTRERTQHLGENINGLVGEQPLACGAIALAIGAIVGAAFPASAYERDLVARARGAGGEMLDHALDQMRGSQAGSDGQTAASPQSAH